MSSRSPKLIFCEVQTSQGSIPGGLELTHLCRLVRSTFAVRETASLGIMGEPRVPPLNPSESIVLPKHYRLEGFKGGTRGAPIMPRDAVSRTANEKLVTIVANRH